MSTVFGRVVLQIVSRYGDKRKERGVIDKGTDTTLTSKEGQGKGVPRISSRRYPGSVITEADKLIWPPWLRAPSKRSLSYFDFTDDYISGLHNDTQQQATSLS